MPTCEWCHRDVPRTYRVGAEDGMEEHVCAACREDVEYCARKGKEPAAP